MCLHGGSEQLTVLAARLDAKHRAAAIEEERRMVADAGASFQHRSTGEIEVERRKVLETTLIVPKIVKGPEGEVGCLQNPVVGLRATRTWIGRHGVHGA
jgi:hypothetical protein